jgi:hypothetical protein
MNQGSAREIHGKTLDKISRDADSVILHFIDGTAIEISGDRPQYGRLLVYYLRPERTKEK